MYSAIQVRSWFSTLRARVISGTAAVNSRSYTSVSYKLEVCQRHSHPRWHKEKLHE